MDNTAYNIKRLRNKFLKSYHNDDLAAAQSEGEELIEYYKKNGITSMREYGSDLFNLACAYDEDGVCEKACDLYRKAADAVVKGGGSESEKLSDIYNNLGIAHMQLHQNDTALAYFKKCYNLRYTLNDGRGEGMTDACYNLGSAYKSLHRFADAAQYYAKALNSRVKKDIAYADNLYNMGLCYIETEDFEIGLDYMSKALEIYKGITANPDEYITALGIYASVLYKVERYESSLESYNTLIELIKENYGSSQPYYANALSHLADCYAKLDKVEKAITLKQKAINVVKKSLGTSHIFYSSCLAELGGLYVRLREYGRAASLYSQALEIRSKILGLDNEECVDYIQTLANIYSVMQLYKKAEDLLNYAINNLPQKNKCYGNLVLELVKLYMDMQDGEGLNRAYIIFNKIHPEKGFDEMLDMAEDLDIL